MSIFHTGGPEACGIAGDLEPCDEFELDLDSAVVDGVDEEGGSTGVFRLSSVSRALVCACCSVGDVEGLIVLIVATFFEPNPV